MKKIIALVMVLGLAACGSSNDEAKENENIAEEVEGAIKIGGIGPLTGGAAIYGQAVKNGAALAVEEINALGGNQYALNFQDDENDAEKSINAYNNLKDWGMHVSIGCTTSTPCVAVAAESYADRIFALTPSASTPKVNEGKDNVFQMCFIDPDLGKFSAEYLAENDLAEKVAIIWKNDDVYSQGIYDAFVEKADELGIEIVSDMTFTTESQNDFSVQLTDAKNSGADLVFLPIYFDAASLILSQADGMGYEPKFLGVDGMDGILSMEGFDTALAEGVMLLTPFNVDSEEELTKNFVTKFKEKFGEAPNQFAADAYDCVYALHQACTNGAVTAEMTAEEVNDILIEQFTTMTMSGLTGENMKWETTGAVSKFPRAVVIENGIYVEMK